MDKSKFNDKREWRKFGIALGIILGIIATILLFKAKSTYIYFYGGGAFFILAALTVPVIIKPVFILFLYIALVLGFIMTRVILSILYYFIITPIGWFGRLFGKQFLDVKFTREKTSYWIETGKTGDEKENYENQF